MCVFSDELPVPVGEKGVDGDYSQMDKGGGKGGEMDIDVDIECIEMETDRSHTKMDYKYREGCDRHQINR